jgi:hypothetical protein
MTQHVSGLVIASSSIEVEVTRTWAHTTHARTHRSTSMRVIHGVHGNTPDYGAPSRVAPAFGEVNGIVLLTPAALHLRCPRLAQYGEVVVWIGDLPH